MYPYIIASHMICIIMYLVQTIHLLGTSMDGPVDDL